MRNNKKVEHGSSCTFISCCTITRETGAAWKAALETNHTGRCIKKVSARWKPLCGSVLILWNSRSVRLVQQHCTVPQRSFDCGSTRQIWRECREDYGEELQCTRCSGLFIFGIPLAKLIKFAGGGCGTKRKLNLAALALSSHNHERNGCCWKAALETTRSMDKVSARWMSWKPHVQTLWNSRSVRLVQQHRTVPLLSPQRSFDCGSTRQILREFTEDYGEVLQCICTRCWSLLFSSKRIPVFATLGERLF